MATHALLAAAGLEMPENDVACVIRGGERAPVGGAGQRRDVPRVAGEQAETVPTRRVPHADRLVAGPREDVEIVGVKRHAIDVVLVADVDPKRLDVIRSPETSRPIV